MHPLIRIRRALPNAIKRATEGGAMHPLWDIIADAELILESRPPEVTTDEVNRVAELLETGWTGTPR